MSALVLQGGYVQDASQVGGDLSVTIEESSETNRGEFGKEEP